MIMAAAQDSISECCFLSVLSDDVLLRICRFLPAHALLGTGATCAELQRRTHESVELWQKLCQFFLGDALLMLHNGCWAGSADVSLRSYYYRRLFRAAWDCDSFSYDHRLRKTLLESVQLMQQQGSGSNQEALKDLLCMSGHTSEALGSLVLQIGGMRNEMPEGAPLHVTVFDLAAKKISKPSLASNSCKPQHRMRHSTCVVNAQFLPEAQNQQAILVLGGHGTPGTADTAKPRPNVCTLLLLEAVREDGSEICWHEVCATGTAPEHIYNHACASFCQGRRVCVFGGDIPVGDPEYARIRNRDQCKFVYVLDVRAQLWQVVDTSGHIPSWRSFHGAVAHTSLIDGREYFVTFGGTPEHCEPLSGARPAPMTGCELDLQTFVWRQGPTDGFMPAARIRFGVARWGRHLLVNGGHGGRTTDGGVVRLNLNSLQWARVEFTNSPPRLPVNGFETGSPHAGLVVGGAHQSALGPRILTRLNLFRLSDPVAPPLLDEDMSADDVGGSSDDDDAAMPMVRIQIPGGDGRPRIVQMPLLMLRHVQREAGSPEALIEMIQGLIADQNEDE